MRALAATMGLLPSEYDAICQGLGRTPTRTEVAVFAGMWSEHCSYKSTRKWLRHLPHRAPNVLAGPGAHAGVVDVGEGWAVAFKIESHNHPSAVEPYQGAATGVGGILRDIIAQGARPCAVLDSLAFGNPNDRHQQHLIEGVVAGIAGYGNAFGVANVGGRILFDDRYEGNPLVNALAAGLVRHDGLRTAAAKGPGNLVLYAGAATGRDGILGAAFASEELSDQAAEDRPHVQVGDPFTGKKLMEACTSFDLAVACQDMGACGLTCASIEMAAAGGVGMHLCLEQIPLREAGMTAQEILLSESQERFLFVIRPEDEAASLAHFRRHGVHAAVCGKVTADGRARATYRDEVVVDLPAALVADGAPESCWALAPLPPARQVPVRSSRKYNEALFGLLRLPSLADKTWLTNRYDQTVGNRTVRGPGTTEAAVLKLPGSRRGFALSLQSRADVCAVDPFIGPQVLLAPAMRDLACSGAQMVAISDGLNVASPRDPVQNQRLKRVIEGLGAGLTALNIPVTGGNCSLYNESSRGPIPPTPMIGALGTVDDVDKVPRATWRAGQRIYLAGEWQDTPAVSHYQANLEVSQRIDMAGERALAALLLEGIDQGSVHCAKTCHAGGIAVALSKLCLRSGVGARLEAPAATRLDWALFGEHPAQALVVADSFDGLLLGEVGGERLVIADAVDLTLEDLAHA
jgi:phosphoribosylformylglycinamidine synthase